MQRKGGKIVSLVCFTLIALTFIKCCIATADTEFDADQKVNLVADEVKAGASKEKGANANKLLMIKSKFRLHLVLIDFISINNRLEEHMLNI